MVRCFRYPIPGLTIEQEFRLEGILVACQRLYNAALEQRREEYRKGRRSPTLYAQQKDLSQLRQNDPEYGTIAALILRSALSRLDNAYKAFFRRLKSGEKPGLPRYRAKHRYDSFSFPLPVINGDRLTVPCFGEVRLKLYRPFKGTPREATVRRNASGKWYVSIVCDLGAAPEKVPPSRPVGLDVGLTHFLTTSTGETSPNPRFYRESEELLAKRQQSLARKRRGSASRKRAKALVAKTHEKIRNQRLDHARKLAKYLVNRFDLIAYEDLNIKGMVQGHFGKSITDAGWRQFILCLQSKAEEAGIWAIGVNPRGTSQRCSKCGEVVKKTLSDRLHCCPTCGLEMDRDHNAALNVLALGLSAVGQALEKATTAEAEEIPL